MDKAMRLEEIYNEFKKIQADKSKTPRMKTMCYVDLLNMLELYFTIPFFKDQLKDLSTINKQAFDLWMEISKQRDTY